MTQEEKPPRWRIILVSIAKLSAIITLGLFVIGFVRDQIHKYDTRTQVESLPPIENYKPTAENDAKLRQFVLDVLDFVMLHETGHLVFSQYDVPVGSSDTNESAADSFAATVMLAQGERGTSQKYNGLMSAAAYWRAEGILEAEDQKLEPAAPGQPSPEPHQPSAARAAKLACLLYGTDPKAFADLTQSFNVEASRDFCVANAEKTRKTWSKLISLNLDPDAGRGIDRWAPFVAVKYHEVPDGLPNGSSATLSNGQKIAQNFGILDKVGNNLLQLRTPFNVSTALAHGALNGGSQQGQLPDFRPRVDHPEGEPSPSAFDFIVVGDSCLNARNEPQINAWWNSQTHTITLCYAQVSEIVYIGKRLLAER
jgi:hypothetical protein